ncbi:MAG TPA: HEAT repeat domain-containing protein [Candidatus Ozemobacteraceae bacterium]|nr:HEAT repeat domain-containing protein [Candidatus Ozemobacteraceae bacterium]
MIPKRQQDLIIQNLRSISAEVRLKSVRQVPNLTLPDDERIRLLTPLLEDAEEEVRTAARRMLTELGGSVPVAAPIPQKPTDPVPDLPLPPADEPVPSEPPAPAVPAVAAALPSLTDEVPEIDASLLSSSTGKKPALSGKRPAGPLVIEAPDLDEQVDPALPDPEKMKSIPELLEHSRFLVRNRPPGHLTQLLWMARQVHEEVALTALQGLLTLKDPRVPVQVLPFLAIPNFSSQRRFLVLKIIMETRSALDVEPLEQVLLAEKDVIVKSGLVKVFARMAGENGVETIRQCLADPDARVRANTVEVIEERNIRSCEDDVAKLLKDPENRVKVNAAKFLVKCGHAEAFATLRSMLGSSEVWLRDSVIFALGEIGDQPSLTLLKAALKDTNQGIRLSVLKALAKINNTVSREVLQSTISDPDNVVAQVARGLWEKIKDAPKPGTSAAQAPVPAPTSVEPAMKPVAGGTVGQPPVGLIAPSAAPAAVPKFSLSAAKPPAKAPVPEPEPEPEPEPQPPEPVLPPVAEEALSLPPVPPAPAPEPPPPPPAEPAPELPLPELEDVPPAVAGKPAHVHEAPSDEAPARSPQPSATAPAAPRPSATAAEPVVPLPPGVKFQKPRSIQVYNRLMSGDDGEAAKAIADMPFIVGDDQNILIYFAAQHANDGVRLAAAKLLARKRGPHAVELMKVLLDDPCELVSSFAAKALTILK